MTSVMQNLINGTRELAEQRERKAGVLNEMEKDAGQAGASGEGAGTDVEAMTPEQMHVAINKLSEIVLQLSERLDGKGVSV